MFEFLNAVFNSILAAFFPKKCIFCGEIIDANEDVCPYCAKKAERIDLNKRCAACGREKDECVCKRFVYRFKEAVALYKYTDNTKIGMFRYKFRGSRHYGKYFAKLLAENVKIAFEGIEFDAVCFVPTDRATVKKRGFDHSKTLAELLSNELSVSVCPALRVKKHMAKQHESSFKERLSNVKGKYAAQKSVTGKILLVDDIMTTGATLDECAKLLLFAGADEVYVATVLSSAFKPNKEGD